jgi:hypothetical protein
MEKLANIHPGEILLEEFLKPLEIKTHHNIMYKTLGFRWLLEAFCPAFAFATADSDEARNPQRFIHVSVG